jgi:hypothetical protein
MTRVISISLQGVLILPRGEISMEDRWLLFSGEVAVAVRCNTFEYYAS